MKNFIKKYNTNKKDYNIILAIETAIIAGSIVTSIMK